MSSAAVEINNKAEVETQAKIDFKMVTFTLAGKDYGINIMKVKEISKASHFTYVPNAAPYVRGVYNLRGEIISIIDLRIMFNLPAQRRQHEALEDILILRMEDHVIGVVVDSVDKVVGVSSVEIQPPHPIFADVNIKYIKGVVESNSKIYIILDVDRVFRKESEVEEAEKLAEDTVETNYNQDEKVFTPSVNSYVDDSNDADLDLGFIIDTLRTFKKFYVTSINEKWIKNHFEEWKKIKGNGSDLQLKDISDAEEYLEAFYSCNTNRLWDAEYSSVVEGLLPKTEYSSYNVWNIGCGKGFESYSLGVLLRKKFTSARIKIWASDNDLLNISAAPSLSFQKGQYPGLYEEYMQETSNRMQFIPQVKDLIAFEYHDVVNNNPIDNLDLIITRDLLSCLSPEKQIRVLRDFHEKLKNGGLLILGDNEEISDFEGWSRVSSGNLVAYRKENV